MERLTIRRDGKVLLRNHPTIRQILDKIAEYEDLEERLNNVYGDCDGLLLRVIEILENHPCIDMANNTLKSRLLTDGDADKWEEYKHLDEQGRLLKLPCKLGDTVWNYSYFGLKSYKVKYIGFDKNGLLYFDCDGIAYGFRCYLKDFKDKIFLTKSEAEARLKELRKE